jgi:hypothetical protein
MANDAQTPPIEYVSSLDGIKEIYCNSIDVNWTITDVRLRIGQILATRKEHKAESQWVVEERAGVTFSWQQAKHLRDMLIQVVDRFEAVNGEIKTPILP